MPTKVRWLKTVLAADGPVRANLAEHAMEQSVDVLPPNAVT